MATNTTRRAFVAGLAGTAGRATNGNLDSRTHGKRMRVIF